MLVGTTREEGETEVAKSGAQAAVDSEGRQEEGTHGEVESESGAERVESLGSPKQSIGLVCWCNEGGGSV